MSQAHVTTGHSRRHNRTVESMGHLEGQSAGMYALLAPRARNFRCVICSYIHMRIPNPQLGCGLTATVRGCLTVQRGGVWTPSTFGGSTLVLTPNALYMDETWGMVTFLSCLSTNVVATSLIALKAW